MNNNRLEQELISIAQGFLRNSSDPFSAVISFLHHRPEGETLAGYVIKHVLNETFGTEEKIPGLIQIFAKHTREIIRHANVISIINERTILENWGKYIIKQTEHAKFAISTENGLLVLKDIAGIFAIEYGLEIPLEEITVKPPLLIVKVKLGVFHSHRTVDILATA